MSLYEIITNLVGPLPTEFTFIYSILTLVLAMLVLSFLFSLFYLPFQILKERRR